MCSGCNKPKRVQTKAKIEEKSVQVVAQKSGVIEKSDNPDVKVKLRYYGGGLGLSSSGGCHSCSGGGKYSLITTENISFASDDSPNGWFSQTFHIGHDYYVTEKQAEYLCTLTYRTQAGEIAHKFKRMD